MSQKVRNLLFMVSAVLLLAGAVLYIIKWIVAPYLFAVGAAGITVCHLTENVANLNFRQKRLHRFKVFSGFFMIAASIFMFKGKMEWVVLLAIAAIFQTYTAFVDGETKK